MKSNVHIIEDVIKSVNEISEEVLIKLEIELDNNSRLEVYNSIKLGDFKLKENNKYKIIEN